MRIVVAGPPKAGNVWLKCLLANAYGIRALGPREFPHRPQLPMLREWIAAGSFADDTIFHQHYEYSPALADQFDSVKAHLVTIVRDPYDAFVSSYYALQTHVDDGLRSGRRTDGMLGKPLDSPEVYDYLRSGGFRKNMFRARDWIQSGRSSIVRYEKLHADPIAELKRVTDAIQSVPEDRLAEAIEACSADNMRQMGGGVAKHVRTAKVGDSREKLNAQHLEIFRDRYAELIPLLGYDVR